MVFTMKRLFSCQTCLRLMMASNRKYQKIILRLEPVNSQYAANRLFNSQNTRLFTRNLAQGHIAEVSKFFVLNVSQKLLTLAKRECSKLFVP